MRLVIVGVALALSSPAVSAEAPREMQGTWATTANDCDALLHAPHMLEKDAQWVKIAPQRISGSTNGKVLRLVDDHTFEASGSPTKGVPMVYELRDGSILAETIGDARGAMLYLRCSR